MYYVLVLLIIVAIIGLIVMWQMYKTKGAVIAYGLWIAVVIAAWYLLNI